MSKFLFKSTIIFFILIFNIVLLYSITMNSWANYLLIASEKHRLLEKTDPPRIIFIGGSNILYSLDSSMVENELNYASINMGLNAGLGLEFMLNEVKKDIKPGDLLVIAPEYELLHNYNNLYYSVILDGNPFLIKYLSMGQIIKLIKYIPKLCQDRLMQLKNEDCYTIDYSTKWFNKHGDLINHINRESIFPLFKIEKKVIKNLVGKIPFHKLIIIRLLVNREFRKNELTENLTSLGFSKDEIKIIEKESLYQKYQLSEVNNETISCLNDFNLYATGRGATVYFSFPCYSSTYYKRNKKEISSIYEQLKKKIEFDILDTPEDNLYNDEYFYDTEYHLRGEGRKLRTYKLITNLKKYIEFADTRSDKFIKEITFGEGGNSIDYEIGGWSYPEEGITWTNGKTAKLLLLSHQIKSNITMKARLSPFLLPGRLDKQRVNIYANDILIDKWIVSSSGYYITTIPENCTGDSDFLKITFECPDAEILSEAARRRKEQRNIGIAFHSIIFSEPQSYELGTNINFSRDGNSLVYQGEGWALPDKDFTWTEGKKSELSLAVDPITSDVIMAMTLEPLIQPGKLDKQRVNVYINNKKIGTVVVTNPGPYQIYIQKDYMKNSPLNIIFELPDATSPRNLGLNNDTKVLALRVMSINLIEKSYKLGTEIYFGKGGNSIFYQKTGWSYQEEKFTWTEGKKAELLLPVENIKSDIIMKIKIEQLMSNKQRVNIYVNDKKAANLVVSSPGEYKIIIPEDCMKTDILNIVFELPEATSPKSLKLSEDTRTLGILVSSIKLDIK